MSSHVSVIFKSGRFRCCSFPLYFCNGFLISSLNLCDEKKPIMVLCMVFTILTKFKRQEIAFIYQCNMINMDFQNNYREKVCI